MSETILTDKEPGQRTPTLSFVVTLVLTMVLVLLGWLASRSDSAGFGGWFIYIAPVGAVVTLLVSRFWSSRPALLGAFGVVLLIVGSGIGRPRSEEYTGVGEGHVISRLETWVPVMAIGFAISVVALFWALSWRRYARRGDGQRLAVMSPGALLTAGLGWIAITSLTQEVVNGYWISGRPLRRPRARSADPSSCSRRGHVSELWLDCAKEEHVAVTAFEDLAARLERVGAPGELSARSRTAAAQERRHVVRCERVAAGLGQPASGAARTHEAGTVRQSRSRRAEITRLAVESFVDGVVGEGFAAGRLEAGAATCHPLHRHSLEIMAAEERGHASLGADIVRWALHEHPTLVRAALETASRRLNDFAQVPDTYRHFRGEELRSAGLVDAAQAQALWNDERRAAMRWLAAMEVGREQPTG